MLPGLCTPLFYAVPLGFTDLLTSLADTRGPEIPDEYNDLMLGQSATLLFTKWCKVGKGSYNTVCFVSFHFFKTHAHQHMRGEGSGETV